MRNVSFYSEYRIEGTHNMVGLEHSTAGFLMRKQLNEEEVFDYTPLNFQKAHYGLIL